MAVIPTNLPQTSPTGTPAVHSAQVKAAQAAFFRAALSEVQETPARQRTASAAQPAEPAEPESQRLPRLGQLLDIRI